MNTPQENVMINTALQHCQLNKTEESLFRDAVGDESDWPKFTNDAKVNWAVDCYTSLLCEDKYPPYNEDEYLEEIAA